MGFPCVQSLACCVPDDRVHLINFLFLFTKNGLCLEVYLSHYLSHFSWNCFFFHGNCYQESKHSQRENFLSLTVGNKILSSTQSHSGCSCVLHVIPKKDEQFIYTELVGIYLCDMEIRYCSDHIWSQWKSIFWHHCGVSAFLCSLNILPCTFKI